MRRLLIGALVCAVVSSGVSAQERGAVTNLELPRFVSLKAAHGNVRRGPSLSHRIDWIFKHRGMPLKVIAEFGHWRRVVDRDGAGGWMHYSLLSGARTVLVEEDLAALYRQADATTPIMAYVELGSIARLGTCEGEWCKVSAGGTGGFIKKAKLWGLLPREDRTKLAGND